MNGYPSVFFEEEGTPSERITILRDIKGRKILRLVRCSTLSTEKAKRVYSISEADFFRFTSGPLVIIFEPYLAIGFASLPSKVSITLWIEKEIQKDSSNNYELLLFKDPDIYLIDSCDENLGDASVCTLVDHRIKDIKILKHHPQNTRLASRPCEVGLIFVLEDNRELILSHGLHDYSDDFAVINREDIQESFLREISEITV